MPLKTKWLTHHSQTLECSLNNTYFSTIDFIHRRGERRMHFDGSSFTVRNAGHSAGFDDHNLLKVY